MEVLAAEGLEALLAKPGMGSNNFFLGAAALAVLLLVLVDVEET